MSRHTDWSRARASIRDLQLRTQTLIQRGVVDNVDDAFKLQYADVSLRAGHKPKRAERFQQYGITSVPLSEAPEALVVHPGGSADHPIILAMDDRRYRLNNLSRGDVALYTHTGQKIHLSPEGQTIRMQTGPSSIELSAEGVRITGPKIWLNE